MKTIRFKGHKNIVGSRVAQARIRAGLKQEDLAAKMQVLEVQMNQQAISKLENDDRIVTDYEVVCLSKALDVSPLWLLGVC